MLTTPHVLIDAPTADLAYGADAAEIDRQNISSRLQRDVEEQSDRMHIFLSRYLLRPPAPSPALLPSASTSSTSAAAATTADAGLLLPANHRPLPSKYLLGVRGHQLSVTAAAVTPDCRSLYTGGKDGQIIRWDLATGRMVRILGRRRKEAPAPKGKGKANGAANGNGHVNGHANGNGAASGSASAGKSRSSGAARRKAMREAKLRNQLAASGQSGEKGKAPAGADGTSAEQAEGSDELAALSLYAPLTENQGHTDEILALAISPDGKYLVSGSRDKRIGVWSIPSPHSPEPEKWLRSLDGHKDGVTSLRFRQSSSSPYELYSSSFDRTVKLWAVDQLSYIETLFGHQDPVLDMDMLRDETALTAGGRDRTVRFWKVRNESQLVFRAGGLGNSAAVKNTRDQLEGGDLLLQDEDAEGGAKKGPTRIRLPAQVQGRDGRAVVTGQEFYEGSIDCVAMIDETHFLSGGDSGSISLWATNKKKPIFTRLLAHGYESFEGRDADGNVDRSLPHARWITSLACLPFGDIFASGSWDGHVRLWALERGLRSFRPLYTIPAVGFVNCLRLVSPPILSAKKQKEAADRGLVSGRIDPAQWRRKGGLTDIGTGKEDAEAEQEAQQENEQQQDDAQPADGEASWAKVRIAKEKVNPLLIIGLGNEHRLGSWYRLKPQSSGVRNGTIVVPLPLRE